MRCLTCDTENKADASYCRNCGSNFNRCVSCDALTESDARYCNKCGKPTGALPEIHAGEATGSGEPNRAESSNIKDVKEVDFTTRVSPRRVEPLSHSTGRGTRAALYVAVVLVVAAVLAAVVMMWINTQAMQRQLAAQPAQRKAELAEMTRLITETRDADRKAIYEQLNQFFTQRLDEEREAIVAEYKEFVTQRLEEERQTYRIETAQAITQTQKKDYVTFVTVLATLKSRTRSAALKTEIDKIIAAYNGKIGGKAQQERVRHKVRPTRNPRSGSVLAD